jgi:hypothetical protein
MKFTPKRAISVGNKAIDCLSDEEEKENNNAK